MGPVLVVALASAYSPAVALAAAAALGLTGTLVVATTPPSRRGRPRPAQSGDGAARRLSNGPLLALFVALLGVGFALGAPAVWAVSMARIHHTDILSGLLPAAFSTSSFPGGLLYGRRTWLASTSRQLLIGSAAFLAGWLPLLALPGPHMATAAVMLEIRDNLRDRISEAEREGWLGEAEGLRASLTAADEKIPNWILGKNEKSLRYSLESPRLIR